MFDQLNKQRKQKNWQIISHNSPQFQQDNLNNKSSFAQQPKKYCPRKQSSKQKIFSKSKQRFNSFAIENGSEESRSHKLIENKSKSTKNIIPLNNRNYKEQGVQTNKNLFSQQIESQNFITSFSDSRLKGSQRSQKQHKNKVYFNNENIFSKKQNPQIIHRISKGNYKIQSYNKNSKVNELIMGDMVGVKQIKQEFQNFKSLIIDELKKHKQIMLSFVQQFIETSETIKINHQLQKIKSRLSKQTISRENQKNFSLFNNQQEQFSLNKKVEKIDKNQKSKMSPRYQCSKQYSEVQKYNRSENDENLEEVNTSFSGHYEQKHQNRKSNLEQNIQIQQTNNGQYTEIDQIEHKIKSIRSAQHLYHQHNKKLYQRSQFSMNQISKIQTNPKFKQSQKIKTQINQSIKQYNQKRKENIQKKSTKNQVLDLQKFNEAIKKLKANLKEIKLFSNTKQIHQIPLIQTDNHSKISSPNIKQNAIFEIV